MEAGGKLKAPPLPPSPVSAIAQQHQRRHQLEGEKRAENRSTKHATSVSYSSNSRSINIDGSDSDSDTASGARSSSGCRSGKAMRRTSNKTGLQTARGAHLSSTATRIKLAAKKAAATPVVESDEELGFPDDGVPRVSWAAFLRFNVPPKKKEIIIIDDSSLTVDDSSLAVDDISLSIAVANTKSLKRKRPEERSLDNDATQNCSDQDVGEAQDKEANESAASKKLKMRWNAMFQQLRDFNQEYGHTRVPREYEQNKKLATWVFKQRKIYTRRIREDNPNAMKDSRFSLLHSLGFETEAESEAEGESGQKEKLAHHTLPQQQQPPQDEDQPKRKEPPKPKPQRKLKARFKKRLDQLDAFKEVFGHMGVPNDYVIVPRLHRWVQKISAKPGMLTVDERGALLDIGFQWSKSQQKQIQVAKNNARRKKKFNDDDDDDDDNMPSNQKKKKSLNATWVKRIKQLISYKEKYGDCRVPINYGLDPSLGVWVHEQRKKFTKRKLADHKSEALEKLEFELLPKKKKPKKLENLEKLGAEALSEKPKEETLRMEACSGRPKKATLGIKSSPQKFNIANPEIESLFRKPKKTKREKQREKGVSSDKSKQEELGLEEPSREPKKITLGSETSPAKKPNIASPGIESLIKKTKKKKRRESGASSDKSIIETLGEDLISKKSKAIKLGIEAASRETKKGKPGSEASPAEKQKIAKPQIEASSEKPTKKNNTKLGLGISSEKPTLETPDNDAIFEKLKLDKVGIEVSAGKSKQDNTDLESAWAKRIEQLKAYKVEHGDCLVPKQYARDPSLGSWTYTTRKKFAKQKRGQRGNLVPSLFRALLELGFDSSNHREKTPVDDFTTRLAQLKAFQQEHGHSLVPIDVAIPGLRQWVVDLRQQYQAKEQGNASGLKDGQIDALNDLDFVWSPKMSKSNRHDCRTTPTESTETYTAALDNSDATGNVCSKSDAIDVEYKVEEKPSTPHGMSEAAFAKKFALLQSFKREFGHTRVPKDSPLPGLRKWVLRVREEFIKHENGEDSYLTVDQIDMLDGVNFEWIVSKRKESLGNSTWAARLQQLERYKSANGTVIVPRSYSADQPFSDWAAHQHQLYARKVRGDSAALSDKDFCALEKLGFGADIAAVASVGTLFSKGAKVKFAQRLEQLRTYHCKYGHANVPPDYREAHGLWKWLERTRRLYTHDKTVLSEKKISSLASLKFDWITSEKQNLSKAAPVDKSEEEMGSNWLNYLKQLVEYEGKHGDTRIPERYKNNQQLADWVHAQRTAFSKRCNGDKDALSDPRFAALNKLGFEAARMDETSPVFQQRITELKDFYGIFGHTKVLKTYRVAPGLRKWLAALRIKYKLWEKGDPTVISVKELSLLGALGFDWLCRKSKFASKKDDGSPSNYTEDMSQVHLPRLIQKEDTSWTGRLRQLEDFKAAHGGVNVPTVYEADQSFSNWVRTQKRLFGQRGRGLTDALADDRFEALQRLGFE